MVNVISHMGVGLLIALALGLKGNKFKVVVLLSVLPDLDFILYSAYVFTNINLSPEDRNQLFYLIGHREFMHSILFILLVTALIWLKTKDRLFTVGGFQSLFFHSYLDYVTSWKMRPLYPFSTDASIMGAVYFFDPLLNLLPLLPPFIVIIGNLSHRRRIKGKVKGFCTFISNIDDKLYASLILLLLVWLTLMPISKALLISNISLSEETEISYQSTYPESMNTFLTAYSYNSTHYKVLKISYLSGIEKSSYVEKVSVEGNVPDSAAYIKRAENLYRAGVSQEIDYPAYSVSESNGTVTVVLSDARSPHLNELAYFKSFYRFVFDRKNEEKYEVYAGMHGGQEEKLGRNWFG
ncbi:metal-dependent hydrolase [Methanosarcina sp.]|uniref:metal-dependent hydrolase n=1 Tax=Methanosarcina sp. TaxID=2213 RepID=UPI003C784CE1